MSSPKESSVYHIVFFSFDGSHTARRIFDQAKDSGVFEGYRMAAQAIVERDAEGDVHMHEPGRGGVGGTVGAIAGGLLGLLGGPVGLVALAVTGGVAGGVAGHFMGRAIPADQLEKLGESLPVNSSAFVAMLEDTEAEKLIEGMAGYQANVVTLTVGDELSGVIGQAVAADVTVTPQEPAAIGAGDTGTPAASAPSTGTATGSTGATSPPAGTSAPPTPPGS